MSREYINRYIHFHAVENVIERGIKLYNNNAVDLVNLDLKLDKSEFIVLGGNTYHVNISDFLSKNIQTSCSCPYDWSVICKHTVASLLHLADILEKKPLEKEYPSTLNNRSTSNPLMIPNWRALNPSIIRKLFPNRYNRYYALNGKITEIISASNSNIIVQFQDDYLYRSNENKIYFELIDGMLYVSSDENLQGIQGLSKAEASCLNYLITNNMNDFFKYFFEGGFTQKVIELKSKFFLNDEDNFNDYFRINVDRKGFFFNLHKKGLGLISPEDNSYYTKGLKMISSSFSATTKENDKEIRELGFAIIANDQYNNSIKIVPIKGKTNKATNEIITHIDRYSNLSDNEFCKPNEKQQKIIDLIKEFNDSYTNINFDFLDYANSNDENRDTNDYSPVELREMLSILQLLFSLLQNEKYVYFSFNPDTYDIRKKDLQRVNLIQKPLAISLNVTKKDQKLELNPYFILPEQKIQSTDSRTISGSSFFSALINNNLFVYNNINTCLYIQTFEFPIKIHEQHFKYFFDEIIQSLSKQFKIEFNKNVLTKSEHFLDSEFRQIYITEENNLLRFNPVVTYSNGSSFPLSDYGNQLSRENHQVIENKRDNLFETEFLEILSQLHPKFERQKHNRFFYLSFDELMQNMWFYSFYNQLQKNNIQVFGINDLKKFKYSPFQAKVSTSLSSGEDWFELKIKVKFGNYEIKISDLKKAIIKKQQFIQLKNGSVGILPEEWLDKFQKYFRNGQINDEKLKISKLRFSVIDELYENIDNEIILKEISDKKQRLKEITKVEQVKVPKGIKADLRHYQKEGLNWLNFLDSMKWGGILADDMGLGKTLQILSFFKLKLKKKDAPALIIVPTTLLFNWENEIAKFSPSLKALYYYGNNRKKDTQYFSNYHLVFTSYGVLVRDIEILKDFQFSYAVLDESQAIKNPLSQRYKAANLLKAKNKFALTGTPIENSTFDLFAQMNFVNPGFFGDIKSFKEDYSNKIDKDSNEEISMELQKLSNPFIMRRTKEQVATELPPKTEDILYCEMETEQRKVYEAYRNEYRDKILKKIENEGLGKSKLFILEGLLRLRQICDSPALLNSDTFSSNQSVKIKELLSFITEKTANHKLLIFSQFVGMLHLIRTELDNHQIDYEYLDGKSSKNQRKESVEHFQSNDSIRVFLVSLKAGGTGLNLTAADYVFLVDPWWNPAVEEQAIDRCYRIGQDKKVFAYRMICKDTIEEKIVKLQSKKKKIASDIIQTDENIMKTLQPSDIRELFS